MYAIVGVKNLMADYDLADGVVHSLSTLFVNIPERQIYYVPSKHFGDEAKVESESHMTYAAIQEIVAQPIAHKAVSPLPRHKEKLSPFEDFELTSFMFAKEMEPEEGERTNRIRQLRSCWGAPIAEQHSSSPPRESRRVDAPTDDMRIESIGNFHEQRSQQQGRMLFPETTLERENLSVSLLRLVSQVALLPFDVLMIFAQVPVELWGESCYPQPQVELLKDQGIRGNAFFKTFATKSVQSDENGPVYFVGEITVSRKQLKECEYFCSRADGRARFRIEATSAPDTGNCKVVLPIEWGHSASTQGAVPKGLQATLNGVNFVTVHNGQSGTIGDHLILSTGPCIGNNGAKQVSLSVQ